MFSRLTVLFEDPFWIGLVEIQDNESYQVCKITFGVEPKDCEIYEFMLKNWRNLKFCRLVEHNSETHRHINPKRMQKIIKKQVQNDKSVGTKAQQALKLQQEQMKTEKKSNSKQRREEYEQRQFELRQKKRKEKHKGH